MSLHHHQRQRHHVDKLIHVNTAADLGFESWLERPDVQMLIRLHIPNLKPENLRPVLWAAYVGGQHACLSAFA